MSNGVGEQAGDLYVLQEHELQRRRELSQIKKLAIATWAVLGTGVGAVQLETDNSMPPDQDAIAAYAVSGADYPLTVQDAVMFNQEGQSAVTPVSMAQAVEQQLTVALPEALPVPELAPTSEVPLGKLERLKAYIAAMPRMEELARLFPHIEHYQNIPEKKLHLNTIAEQSVTTTEAFRLFTFNTNFQTIFNQHPNYQQRIQPQIFVIHWTGKYYDNVLTMRDEMMAGNSNRKSVAYIIDKITDGHSQTYRTFEDDFRFGAHALGANDLGQGVEIMAGRLEDIQPQQFANAVMLTVDYCRRNKLEINQGTVVSHAATDLLLNNKTFDPITRNVGSMRKFDIQQEFIDLLISRAQDLDAALGPR